VALGHSLGLRVIAEGVETRDQVDRLRALECDDGQGFLFSKPRSAQQIDELLAGWSADRLADSAPAN
jgi:EAL domain-containing protein (putative c-di-GMP-specific phosphodiesterase class I)